MSQHQRQLSQYFIRVYYLVIKDYFVEKNKKIEDIDDMEFICRQLSVIWDE